MDADAPADDKKPLASLEEATNEEESQPDPDEILQVDAGIGKIWLVKLPKFLMERWSAINADGVHLATLRVWNERDGKGKQRMKMFLPPEHPGGPMEEYTLDMVQEVVENQVVIAETDKEPGNPASRAKSTVMTGRIKHEVNVRPSYNEDYSIRMRARHEAASEPQRQIKMIEDSHPGGRGNINMLSSGANQRTGSFDALVRTSRSGRNAGQQHERFARMPQNELLDALFALFREKEFWSVRELRTKTEQPEAYLKETLSQIATLHRSGPHNGLWSLMANFKDGLAGSSLGEGGVRYSSDVEAPNDVKMEGVDDEDDDDDDMEEIP